MVISHIKNIDSKWIIQTNDEHQLNVSILAAEFLSELGMSEWGKVLGLLHDKGKEQHAFQRYIEKASGYKPELNNVKRVPHSFVGALLAKKIFPESYPLLSMPIISHHTGLYDYADFKEKMKVELPCDIRFDDIKNIQLKLPFDKYSPLDFHHLARVLYSCLVDADRLDTERFMDKSRFELRMKHKTLEELLPLLNRYLNDFSKNVTNTSLNILRSKIQMICKESSKDVPGFYSLTVPTGGGKTLSSLVWAINHAIRYGKKRIIIAIPYTSIITQTASILKGIFGDDNVLEHHSAINDELEGNNYEDFDNLKLRQLLATENWDYPIVVTTNVQLFESMHSNRPSKCRKLHNICNSVLILDEVQMLPTEHLQPVVDALSTYVRLFHTSVLFTTASQPVLSGDHYGCNYTIKLKGLSSVREIIPTEMCLHDKLRRVNLHIEKKPITYDDLAKKLIQYDKVLCIVNTRQDAKEVYSRLPNEGSIYHLSRMMCSAHIQKIISEIKSVLNNPGIKVVRVVATQLIEAGVDIDFPVVFRQEAGLDSVLQAAGRCNREGKLGISDAYVFSFNHPLPPGTLSRSCNTLKNMIGVTDWFAPDTMKDYFISLYTKSSTFDKVDVEKRMDIKELCFELVAEEFRLIDNKGKSVIVNYENSLDLVQEIKNEGISYNLMKKLSNYMVNLREVDFIKLKKERLLEEVVDGIYLLPDREQYDINTGLVTDNHWLEEILIQ